MQLVNIVVRYWRDETWVMRSCSFVYRFRVCSFALSLAVSLSFSLFRSLPRSFSHILTYSAYVWRTRYQRYHFILITSNEW